jgi:hypothetical protein
MVTITNSGARGVYLENGKLNGEGWNWTSSTVISAGHFSSSVAYVAQLWFRLDKPCKSITLFAKPYDAATGKTIYWKVSNSPWDVDLLNRVTQQSNEPNDGSLSFSGTTAERLTINGNFPANTDLYLYGFCYSPTGSNCRVNFNTASGDNKTRVVEAVEGSLGSYVYYNDNGNPVKCEVYCNDNGVAKRCDVYYNDNGQAVKT